MVTDGLASRTFRLSGLCWTSHPYFQMRMKFIDRKGRLLWSLKNTFTIIVVLQDIHNNENLAYFFSGIVLSCRLILL